MFDVDDYNNRPKILFIGNPTSSHVQGWINLLNEAQFNIRLFASAEGYPSSDWKIKTYIITKYPPENLDEKTRRSWFPKPEEWYIYNDEIEKAKKHEYLREKIIQKNNDISNDYISKRISYQLELDKFILEFINWKETNFNDKQINDINNRIKEFEISLTTIKQEFQLNNSLLKNKYYEMTNNNFFKPNNSRFYKKFAKQIIFLLNFFSIKKSLSLMDAQLINDFHILLGYLEKQDSLLKNFEKFFSENKKLIENLFFGNNVNFLNLPIPNSPLVNNHTKKIPNSLFPIDPPQPKTSEPVEWLASIIKNWKPDIIYTFGVQAGSAFYYNARKKYNLEEYGKWIIKVFGGSDIDINIFKEDTRIIIKEMFSDCHEIIFDNTYHSNLVVSEGLLEKQKISKISPLPGSGGINVKILEERWKNNPPSKRKNILWPKSYESIWSKAVPVLMALMSVWNKIEPCTIYMLTVNEEIKEWLFTVPKKMRQHIITFEGVPRDEVLNFMLNSRIVLSPSLIDGIPNVIYESMACGCIPIASPLDSIKTIINKDNVFFAENLKQDQIERGIIKLMTDDKLVDQMAFNNLSFVKSIADSEKIKTIVKNYYEKL